MSSRVPLTFLGQVVKKSADWNAVRVSVLKLKLDPYLKLVSKIKHVYCLLSANALEHVELGLVGL